MASILFRGRRPHLGPTSPNIFLRGWGRSVASPYLEGLQGGGEMPSNQRHQRIDKRNRAPDPSTLSLELEILQVKFNWRGSRARSFIRVHGILRT